jgi:predicted dehydrogenase
MEPLKVGLIGINFGRQLAVSGTGNGSIELKACFSLDPDAGGKFASEFSCDTCVSVGELVVRDDIEAVLIAAPNHEHAGLAWQAASNGKHVFVDKPISNTISEASEMITFCRAAGVKLCVGHNSRFCGSFSKIRELIRQGRIGKPISVECHCGSANVFDIPPGNWRRSASTCPSLALIQMGIHQIDTMRTILGEVLSVSSHFENVMVQMPNPDFNATILEFDSGATALMANSYIHNDFYTIWHGSEGVLRYMNWPDEGQIERLDAAGHVPESDHWIEFESVDSLGVELRDFQCAVREDREPTVNGEEGLKSLLPVAAAVESDRAGRRVFIDELV